MNNVLLQSRPLRDRFGFRDGNRGTHTTRTIMLAELRLLLEGNSVAATKSDYRTSIIDNNILGKSTQSTRQEIAQRLSQLYGLDQSVTVFRLLRFFWTLDHQAQPLLALLCAMARDPLLRITVDPILQAAPGQVTGKQEIERAVAQTTLNCGWEKTDSRQTYYSVTSTRRYIATQYSAGFQRLLPGFPASSGRPGRPRQQAIYPL